MPTILKPLHAPGVRRTRARGLWALPLRAAVQSGQRPPPVTSHLKTKGEPPGSQKTHRRPTDGLGSQRPARPLPLQGPAPPRVPSFPFPGGGCPAAGGWKLDREGPPAWQPPGTAPHPGLRQAERFRQSRELLSQQAGQWALSPLCRRGDKGREGQGGVRGGGRGGGGRGAGRWGAQSSLQGALAVGGLRRPFLSARAPDFRPD